MPRRSPASPPSVDDVLAGLRKLARKQVLAGMSRYGLPSDKAWGVGVGDIQRYGKQLGKSQALAEALWTTDVYEARLLAASSARRTSSRRRR